MEMRESESVCMFEFLERERVCVCVHAYVCVCVCVCRLITSASSCAAKYQNSGGRGVSEDCTDPGSGQSSVL